MRGSSALVLVAVIAAAGCRSIEYKAPPDADDSFHRLLITGAGTHDPACTGYCDTQLMIYGDQSVGLEIIANDGHPPIANAGRLSDAAVAERARLDNELYASPPAPTYGCPSCAGKTSAYIDMFYVDVPTVTTYEGGNPPTELMAADTMLTDIAVALATCSDSSRVTVGAGCTPR